MSRVLSWTVLILGLVLILSSFTYAQTIDIYKINFDVDKTTSVEQSYIFLEPVNQEIPVGIPNDAKNLYVFKDNVLVLPNIMGNKVIHTLDGNKELTVKYQTESFVDDNDFMIKFNIPYNVNKMLISAKLPKEAVLKKPISGDTIEATSVYPTPKSLASDGQSVIVNWEFDGLEEGQEISLFVEYGQKSSFVWITMLVISILALLLVIGYFVFFRPQKERIITKEIIKKEEADIEEHLKEDEAQIIRILKDRDRQVEQGTLRVITGFSKAKLSGLLFELEARKIIFKEKRGKKNLVFLRKQ